MSKKIILILMGIVFFSGYHLARADVVINEVMYDLSEGSDTGREWIEIYNNSNATVDLSTYKFFEADTNHAIIVSQGDANVEGHDYVIVASDPAKFKIDWPNFSGNIFDSSFSLSNEGEALALKDVDLNVVDQYTYSSTNGANGDGHSLQLVGGSWVASVPTPGEANESAGAPASDDDDTGNLDTPANNGNDNNTTSTAPESKETKPKMTVAPAIKAKIFANALAFTGQPLEIKTSVSGFSNENVVLGRVYWNFGDGSSLEQINNFEKFYHTYYYPGEYVVFLEYYQKSSSKTPDTTSKIIVKVVPITVTISKVGDAKDFFVELLNDSSSDIDISNWVINANGKIFILPKNSVIMSKKRMTIPGKTTLFTYGDQSNLKLFSSTGELVFDYSSSIVRTIPAKIQNKNTGELKISPVAVQPIEMIVPTPKEEIPVENLEASVMSSDVVKNNSLQNPFLVMILTIFIGASAGAVYFIRKKRIVPKAGDDFKILDE